MLGPQPKQFFVVEKKCDENLATLAEFANGEIGPE